MNNEQHYCPPKSNDHYLDPKIGLLETPFKHIALAMSGGGFRAGAFSLGVLSYLKQVPYFEENPKKNLLENVTYLSSASGGTIATSTYALAQAQGMDFSSYYAFLSDQLTGVELVETAMQLLNDKTAWYNRQGKERNVINAFALAYDHLLLQGQTAATLKDNPHSHLDEVCFNTTEFYNGLLFRQSVKLKEDAHTADNTYFLYGNFKLHLAHKAAEKLHLADMLAASSCFPGGFEPIVFPNDFADSETTRRDLLDDLHVELEECSWPELNRIYGSHTVERIYNNMPKPVDPKAFIKQLQNEPIQDDFSVCFMDGGITDNQGLESMVQANKRRVAGHSSFKPFDLMMVCDVDSHYISPYELPAKSQRMKSLTIRKIILASWLVFGFSLGASLFIWLGHWLCNYPIWKGVLGILTILLALTGLLVIRQIYSIKKYISREVDGSGIGLDRVFSKRIRELIFKFFGTIPFNRLFFMLKVRLTSLLMISMNIFMARIRHLLYDQFFNQDDLKRSGRAKSNHIYDLAFSNDKNRSEKYNTRYTPSEEMQIIAEYAMNMPTTLWFSKDGQHRKMQAAITACGQFTTCYNLLDYIIKLQCDYGGGSVFSKLTNSEQQLVKRTETFLAEHFEHFRANPFWLYNQLGEQTGIKDFYPADISTYDFPEEFKGLR